MAWRHYTLEQMSRSSTAKQLGIDNTPKGDFYNHMDELVTTILDPLTDAWGSDLIITSCWRCPELNKKIGGSTTSAHVTAYAADMVPKNGQLEKFKDFSMKWLLNNNINFDQYINEYSKTSSWVHIGVRNQKGNQRKQYKLYRNGVYTVIDPFTFKSPGLASGDATQVTVSYSSGSSTTSTASQTYGSSSNFTSTTSGIGYGLLTGTTIYTNDIDYDQIKANDIFLKSDSGELIVDPATGDFEISDAYLFDSGEMTVEEDAENLPKEPDSGMQEFLSKLSSSEVEKVSGISFNSDGSYAVEQSPSLRELMVKFWTWWEMIQTLKKSISEYKKAKFEKKQNSANDEDDEELVIDVSTYTKAAFDKFGHALRDGVKCPICGTQVSALMPGGYCSLQCALEDQLNKIKELLLQPNDKYKDIQEILESIAQIIQYVNVLINALTMIPDIIKELCHFPEVYRKYVKKKIAEGFCYLQEMINELMIKKNEALKKLLDKMKFGVIVKPFAKMYVIIETIQEALKTAREAFNEAYNVAITAIKDLKDAGGMAIDAESFAWICSPRSYSSPLPYTCPDAGKVFVNLPGGSGIGKIELMKPLMPSGLCNIDYSKIETFIQNMFPPLTPVDYYLPPNNDYEPDAILTFEARYMLSDQSDFVTQIRQQLTDLLVGGPDYLPAYENLLPVKKYTNITIGSQTYSEMWLPNMGYLWFIVGLMDSWAPHSKALVGSFMNPAI